MWAVLCLSCNAAWQFYATSSKGFCAHMAWTIQGQRQVAQHCSSGTTNLAGRLLGLPNCCDAPASSCTCTNGTVSCLQGALVWCRARAGTIIIPLLPEWMYAPVHEGAQLPFIMGHGNRPFAHVKTVGHCDAMGCCNPGCRVIEEEQDMVEASGHIPGEQDLGIVASTVVANHLTFWCPHFSGSAAPSNLCL